MEHVTAELANHITILKALITPENRKYSTYMIELLTSALNKILSLEDRISDLGWEHNPDRMGS